MIIGAFIDCLKFEINFCNQTISHVAIVVSLYAAFVFDSAIVDCFLLFQLTAALPKENMKSLVDFLSETLSTQ